MSQSQTHQDKSLNITVSPINAFNDNYLWVIGRTNHAHIAIVDPGDANACIEYIEKNNKKLSTILITHHHKDHTGGINLLKQYCEEKQWPLTIYAPKNEPVNTCDIRVSEQQKITIAELDLNINIIDLPGHTHGHIAYLTDDKLFCGDTLFSGGCGRVFEGTAEQMLSSLNKLKALPEKTHVYCAHEYTLANLNFALTVDPENLELVHYYNQVKHMREKNQATIPTSIRQEKLINPFLRCSNEAIRTSVQEYNHNATPDELSIFTHLRLWKDHF